MRSILYDHIIMVYTSIHKCRWILNLFYFFTQNEEGVKNPPLLSRNLFSGKDLAKGHGPGNSNPSSNNVYTQKYIGITRTNFRWSEILQNLPNSMHKMRHRSDQYYSSNHTKAWLLQNLKRRLCRFFFFWKQVTALSVYWKHKFLFALARAEAAIWICRNVCTEWGAEVF